MSKPEDIMDKIVSGELSRQEAIEANPDLEDRLTILGSLADELRQLPPQQPDGEFKSRARLRLLQHIQETQRREPWWRRQLQPLRRLPGWAPAGVASLLAGGVMVAGVSYAAASALPDDKLYPVKRAVEQVQIVVARSDEAKANTYLDIADRRATEIAAAAPDLDDAKVEGLSNDYGAALQTVGAAVQNLPAPRQELLIKVQSHVASQATEIEARAVNSSTRPQVQRTLTHAETVASDVSDHVSLIAERTGKPGPQDVQLAANAPAAATAAAQAGAPGTGGASSQVSVTGPAGSQPAQVGATGPAGSQGAQASTSGSAGVQPAQLIATPATPPSVTVNPLARTAQQPAATSSAKPGAAIAGVDGPLNQLWNEVAAAPFMAHTVRVALEVQVTAAKQAADAGKADVASAELTAFISQLQQAVKANQATQYTASHLTDSAQTVLTTLKSAAAKH